MKKKLFGAVLFSFVFLLVAACGSQEEIQKGKGETKEADSTEKSADYPSKTITYSIPFDPGGQSDVEARRQQPYLEEMLGQKVTIQYKPGGGGAVGWTELVGKKPDGYFISGMNIPHIILQPLSNKDTGYKTEDIVPVAIVQATPIGIAVSKDSDIDSLEDLVAAAQEKPGSITVAGSGTYTGHHISFLQLQDLADIKMQYVPFNGAAPSVQAFLGGTTKAIMANSSDLVKYEDKMKILAIGSEKTFKPLPDVPTFKELGYDMTAAIDRGVAVPPGTSAEAIQTLEEAFLEIVKKEEVQEQMYEEGFEPKTMGHEASKEYIRTKTEQYSKIMKEVGE